MYWGNNYLVESMHRMGNCPSLLKNRIPAMEIHLPVQLPMVLQNWYTTPRLGLQFMNRFWPRLQCWTRTLNLYQRAWSNNEVVGMYYRACLSCGNILHGVAWTQKEWLGFNVAPCFTSQVPHGYTRIPCVPVGWDSFEGWWWIGSHCHDDLFSFEIIMCLSTLEQPWPLHTWCSFSYLHLLRRIQCSQMPVSFLNCLLELQDLIYFLEHQISLMLEEARFLVDNMSIPK